MAAMSGRLLEALYRLGICYGCGEEEYSAADERLPALKPAEASPRAVTIAAAAAAM